MQKKNCWEVMKCGREPGGANVKEIGICPASTDEKLHGIHGGKNAGRACWVVAGTYCEGAVQGTFAKKYNDCALCEFYKQVRHEEGKVYQTALVLLKLTKIIR